MQYQVYITVNDSYLIPKFHFPETCHLNAIFGIQAYEYEHEHLQASGQPSEAGEIA